MTTWAYLRVSSLQQDEDNQRQGVDKKADELNLKINKYVIDKVSGVKEPDERNLGRLLRRARDGDVILISELSRFGRRMYMLFRIIDDLLNRGVKVYTVKENISLDGSVQSTVLVFAFGLAGEIEQRMISARTKEALQRKKAMGIHLGRKVGQKVNFHKMTDNKEKIMRSYKRGVSKRKLAKKYRVDVKTIRKYIREWQTNL